MHPTAPSGATCTRAGFPNDLAYRPCFSTTLLKELRDFQLHTAETMRRPAHSRKHVFGHVVVASAADVYNLGGDLDLFCRLIRAQDRNSLMAYARQCVEVAYAFYRHLNEDAHTVALVQGDALGGGFELALCCQTIVAESGVGMGFPEVLFDLFPGMGAYSFLRRRVSSSQAQQMMLDGRVYSSDELHKMGVVDILVPKGEGVAAVRRTGQAQSTHRSRALGNEPRRIRLPSGELRGTDDSNGNLGRYRVATRREITARDGTSGPCAIAPQPSDSDSSGRDGNRSRADIERRMISDAI